MKVNEVQSSGVKWQGTDDTQLFKVTGSASTTDGHTALYDVKVGRCNSSGTFTEVYVRLSKFSEEANMYTPFEAKLYFPAVADPDASWQDVWKDAFFKSAEALKTDNGGVPLSLGVDVLNFAEKAGESWKKGTSIPWD